MLNLIRKLFATSSGYESARRYTRRRGAVNLAAVRDQREDLQGGDRLQLVKASRQVARNSGFHQALVTACEDFAVGAGQSPRSLAEDNGAAADYLAYFAEFSKAPEITNRFTLPDLQRFIVRAILIDGELFLNKTKDRFGSPKCQVIGTQGIAATTDRARRIYDGVVMDSVGRIRGYKKASDRPGSMFARDLPTVRGNQVIHAAYFDSATAVRGLPMIQHGLNKLRDVDELLAFETHATKQAGEIGLAIYSDRPEALEDADFGLDSEGEANSSTETDTALEQEIAAALGGRAVRMDVGEKLEAFKSERPNSMFSGFLRELKQDSAGGFPAEVAQDPSSINGAAVRLVAAKADARFNYVSGLVSKALSELYVYALGVGISNGDIAASPGWSRVSWRLPRRLSVDAGREDSQARENVMAGLSTFSSFHADRGEDFEDFLKVRSRECRAILNAAGYPDDTPIPLSMIYRPNGGPTLPEAVTPSP